MADPQNTGGPGPHNTGPGPQGTGVGNPGTAAPPPAAKGVTPPVGAAQAPTPAQDDQARAQNDARARADAQRKANEDAAKHGVVAGQGAKTVEVDAPRDSLNKDGTRKHRVHVNEDGVARPAEGATAAAVVHDPDPATQMGGAPDDREDGSNEEGEGSPED